MGKTCIYCKRNLGFLNGKINLNDGNAICTACAEKAGINTFSGTAIVAAQNISSENLIRMIDGKKPLTSEDMMLVPYREKIWPALIILHQRIEWEYWYNLMIMRKNL